MRRLALLLILAPALADALDARTRSAWPETDFSRVAVPLEEIVSGGPGRDGIPAVSDPTFRAAEAATEIDPREPVVSVALAGEARAYPVRYLMWTEIVNDLFSGRPVAVTFCPLCNASVVFDRRVGGRVLEFGVSGLLRHSDLIMYDRQTHSWWQQFTGRAIVGELIDAELDRVPSRLESFAAFRAREPEGAVMAPPPLARDWGRNPYAGYDRAERPFLYTGEDPPHGVPPMARVLAVGERAWPLDRLRRERVVEEAGLRIDWREGQASALDSGRIADGREVGDLEVTDAATGEAIGFEVPFAFAFHAFRPDGVWMTGDEGG